MISRRSLITGLISLVAAPAIVRAGSLMPVKQMVTTRVGYTSLDPAAIYQITEVWVHHEKKIYWAIGQTMYWRDMPEGIFNYPHVGRWGDV